MVNMTVPVNYYWISLLVRSFLPSFLRPSFFIRNIAPFSVPWLVILNWNWQLTIWKKIIINYMNLSPWTVYTTVYLSNKSVRILENRFPLRKLVFVLWMYANFFFFFFISLEKSCQFCKLKWVNYTSWLFSIKLVLTVIKLNSRQFNLISLSPIQVDSFEVNSITLLIYLAKIQTWLKLAHVNDKIKNNALFLSLYPLMTIHQIYHLNIDCETFSSHQKK